MPKKTEKAPDNRGVVPIIAVIAVVGILTLAIGAGVGYMLGSEQAAKTNYDNGYRVGIEEARKKVGESRMFPSRTDVRSVSGRVLSVGADSLQLEVAQLVTNPLEQPAPTKRTVKVAAVTKIIGLILKSAEERKSEADAYAAGQQKFSEAMRKGDRNAKPPVPPQPFTQKEITLTEIGVGSTVSAVSETNILMAETFTATEIQVNQAIGGATPGMIVPAAVPMPPTQPAPAR